MTPAPHRVSRAKRRKARRQERRHQATAHLVLHGWLPMCSVGGSVALWHPQRELMARWATWGVGYYTSDVADRNWILTNAKMRECEWEKLAGSKLWALRDLLNKRGWLQ